MKNIFHSDFTWKELWSTLFGLALAILIFFGAFLLPAYIEYMAREESQIQDMYGSYTIYTIVSWALFFFAIRKNFWYHQNRTFVTDALAIAIGFNCVLWGLIFIGHL